MPKFHNQKKSEKQRHTNKESDRRSKVKLEKQRSRHKDRKKRVCEQRIEIAERQCAYGYKDRRDTKTDRERNREAKRTEKHEQRDRKDLEKIERKVN